jgi:hypothetical protein
MTDITGNKRIAADLAFYSFVVAMVFFAIVRFLGLLWFKAGYVSIDMQPSRKNHIKNPTTWD